ncbi:MAG: hypothetical protein EAY75_12915, partial [Bacteroidetes bacterium]
MSLLWWACPAAAQKPPLNHKVYDQWESIQERVISANGQWLAFTVNPQEGDGNLIITLAQGNGTKLYIPRGYAPVISPNSAWCSFKIRAPFAATREGRIKKKRPDDMPKDSLGWVNLATLKVQKIPRIKGFKMPEEGADQMAYLTEKPLPDTAKRRTPAPAAGTKTADSLRRTIDSLQSLLQKIPEKVGRKYWADAASDAAYPSDADGDAPATTTPVEEGTTLTLLQLASGTTRQFERILEY